MNLQNMMREFYIILDEEIYIRIIQSNKKPGFWTLNLSLDSEKPGIIYFPA